MTTATESRKGNELPPQSRFGLRNNFLAAARDMSGSATAAIRIAAAAGPE
jgi:hypothetical protein